MKRTMKTLTYLAAAAFLAGVAFADDYDEALASFKGAEKSAKYFAKAYGYALFPEIGKAGLIVGGEHGDGQVYEKGKLVGTATLTQLSVGAQAGAKQYAEIIFF